MARDEDGDRPAPKREHRLGEALDAISVNELRERIALLREEIARLDAEVDRKQASRSAAEGFFRR